MSEIFEVKTRKQIDVVDITEAVNKVLRSQKSKNGLCCVYVPHATAALIINENADPNVVVDFLGVLDKLIPLHDNYKHDAIDNNAAAHIKSALIGCEKTIPFKDSELDLGTWQDLMLCDFDGPRTRKVIVKVVE